MIGVSPQARGRVLRHVMRLHDGGDTFARVPQLGAGVESTRLNARNVVDVEAQSSEPRDAINVDGARPGWRSRPHDH